MGLALISSPPSPYARKVRIALAEKKIPFELRMETPWDKTTETPTYNPLEKLPIIVVDDGKDSVYESHLCMEWVEAKYPQAPVLTPPASDFDARIKAKKIEVVADGIADALILEVWEIRREESKQSPEWAARQRRKVEGGLKAMEEWVKQAGGGFLVDGKFGLADISVGSMMGFLNFRSQAGGDKSWREKFPNLVKYWNMLEERQSFKDTVPDNFPNGGIQDKVV